MSQLTPDRLHILFITPYYSPAWAYGGPVRVAYETARRLVKRGHKVTVATTDALDANSRAAAGVHVEHGVEIHRVKNASNQMAWRRLFIPGGFGSLAARLTPTADVVHIHEFRSLLNMLALPALKKHRTPFVISPHGSLPSDLGRTAFKRTFDYAVGQWLVNNATLFHAITNMEAQQYFQLEIRPEQIVGIPNGIEADSVEIMDTVSFRQEHGISENQPVIGFIGRLNPIKGVDFLIDAFAEVLSYRPDAVLAIAGPDDGAQAQLETQVDRLGIREAVRFIGFINSDLQKNTFYQAVNTVVLPSRYEILGITLLESLLNRTPVVATSQCGLSSLLASTNIGNVVPFGDPPLLADVLLHIIDNPEAHRAQAAAGREHVIEHFNWEAITDRWEAVYYACLPGSRLPSSEKPAS